MGKRLTSSPLCIMRTFDQLSESERSIVLKQCHVEVADILFNGIILFQDENLNELLSEAIEKSEGDFEIFYDSPVIVETTLGSAIDDMAEAMAINAEYPSTNEDGSYKKVIQL